MKYLMIAAAIAVCPTKDSNMQDLLKIQDYMEETVPDQEIELPKLSQEDLYERIRQASMDPELPSYPNEKFTKAELEMKRAGVDCVKCDINAEDPNMRPEVFRRF